MPALPAGKPAPDFTLKAMDGSTFSLSEALTRGPVVLAFFKISCPVCQYALPFLERIHRAYPGLTLIGISQDNPRDTAEFLSEFDIAFPIMLDAPDHYAVSDAYGLTNVPTIFWIAADGRIEISSVGWSKQDVAAVNAKAAQSTSQIAAPLFQPGERIADFRAG